MSAEALQLPRGNWTLPTTPSIAPAARSALSPVARGLLWLMRQRTREPEDFNVFLTMARLGRLFPAHTVFLSQLLGKTRLSPVEKEIVVLRTAWRLGCAYEFSHHHAMAKDLGVPPTLLDAATAGEPTDLPARLAALLRATDELVREHKLSDSELNTLRRHCSEDEILELCMFVGHYVMIAMIINTAGIQPEPNFAVALPKLR